MSVGSTVNSSKLYTPRLLGLAASLYHHPYNAAAPFLGEARSQTCGSSIKISAKCDVEGRISQVGMVVTACAIGQASAAILADGAAGKSSSDIEATLSSIENWLRGEGAPPDWPGFDALYPTLSHHGRHGALLIPWKGIIDALSSGPIES
ncbi:MAG: iron-sulfur cluster assembly scaffold protein [Pseudomonadota bacterium]